eukprot:comp15815_c0_seq1/m.13091 comp15815_c0_seq1/g.13091  ORF comp15815_c0_seq1/g.13091 comp15815_c0_seq1/m.13091 type:complete len:108 (+) comp15815_c0_seq1:81-404(+)
MNSGAGRLMMLECSCATPPWAAEPTPWDTTRGELAFGTHSGRCRGQSWAWQVREQYTATPQRGHVPKLVKPVHGSRQNLHRTMPTRPPAPALGGPSSLPPRPILLLT